MFRKKLALARQLVQPWKMSHKGYTMKLTKSKLKRIIKEELSNLQQEGFLDMFKKKQEDKSDRLKRITMEDIMASWGRDITSLYQMDDNAAVRKKVEKDVDALVQKMLTDPRGGGPRDHFERSVRQLAAKYKNEIK